jgi:small basic protein
MLPILNLVLSVLASCATLYLVDDAYQSYLERAPLREFVFKALCAASSLVLSVALWLALYLA